MFSLWTKQLLKGLPYVSHFKRYGIFSFLFFPSFLSSFIFSNLVPSSFPRPVSSNIHRLSIYIFLYLSHLFSASAFPTTISIVLTLLLFFFNLLLFLCPLNLRYTQCAAIARRHFVSLLLFSLFRTKRDPRIGTRFTRNRSPVTDRLTQLPGATPPRLWPPATMTAATA